MGNFKKHNTHSSAMDQDERLARQLQQEEIDAAIHPADAEMMARIKSLQLQEAEDAQLAKQMQADVDGSQERARQEEEDKAFAQRLQQDMEEVARLEIDDAFTDSTNRVNAERDEVVLGRIKAKDERTQQFQAKRLLQDERLAQHLNEEGALQHALTGQI